MPPARRLLVVVVIALAFGIVANIAWYSRMSGNSQAIAIRSSDDLHSLVVSESKAVTSQYGFEAALGQVAPGGVLIEPEGLDQNGYRLESLTQIDMQTREYDTEITLEELLTLPDHGELHGSGAFLAWSWEDDDRNYVVMWNGEVGQAEELWLFLNNDEVYIIDIDLLAGIRQ